MTDHNSGAFGIKTILVNSAISARYCDEVIRSLGLENKAKKLFRDIERKLKSIEMDIRLLIAPEMADLIRKEVSENWENMSVHNIQVMLMSMNDEQRQIAESACAHILDGTFRIEPDPK